MSTKISLEITLSAEDRKAIVDAVEAKIKGVADAAAKGAGKGKGGKAEPAAAEAEDDFENTDGVEDAAGEDDFDTADEPKATKNDVQIALRDYAAATSKSDAMKLLAKHGETDGLSNLKEAKFAAVIKAANAATTKAKKK